VTVTSLPPKVVGNYDVTFMGDRFTGSFDADPCSVPQYNEQLHQAPASARVHPRRCTPDG
jgi:hypothetical protein